MKDEINASMTVGKPMKLIIRFVIPLIISGLIQQLYSIIDSIIAGKFVGTDALASVGLSGNVLSIFMIISGGLGFGGSVLLSQEFGRRAYGRLKTTIRTLMIVSIFLGIIISIAGLLLSRIYLMKLNTPAQLFEASLAYFRIYISGMALVMFYEIMIFIFTSLGNSVVPLLLLITSSVLNIILDLIFVLVFHLDVAGLALATILSQAICAFLAFLLLNRQLSVYKEEGKHKLFSIKILRSIIGMSLPPTFQQAAASFGILLVQVLVNGFGTETMAGFTAAGRLLALFLVPFINLSQASGVFTAQNYGAGLPGRISEGNKAAVKLSFFFYIPLLILAVLFGKSLIGLFTSREAKEAVEKAGYLYICISVPFIIIASYKYICDGILRGCGRMKAFLFSCISDFASRVIISYMLVLILHSFTALPIALSAGWLIGAIVSNRLIKING